MKRVFLNFLFSLFICLVASSKYALSKATANEPSKLIENQDSWRPLFNKRNLKGWHALPGGEWKVVDGILVGRSPESEPLHGILLSDKTYGDFKLKVIYKAVKGNSGVYFRVTPVKGTNGVKGLQAEIDPDKDAGGLYDTGGRNWVVQPTPEEVKTWYKPNEWNEMVIVCQGRDVTVFVNGIQTAQLMNDSGNLSGYIGLQLHGSMDMEVLFKEVLISE